MATEAEYRRALDTGAAFRRAVLSLRYDQSNDAVIFETPWGERTAGRRSIEPLRNVPPDMMRKAYVSAVGIHIDELDIDISSAGLLLVLFPDLGPELSNSF